MNAKLEDLSWMQGSWSGSLGKDTLEEHWIEPCNGSMAGLIRITSAAATRLIEMVMIEPENDTLVFRVRQWGPGYEPIMDSPITLQLADVSQAHVVFTALGDSGLQRIAYSCPDANQFHIDVETSEGAGFSTKLRRI